MGNDELVLEVHRLRVLDRQHRRISEQAESDVRRLRSRIHTMGREMVMVSDRLRHAISHELNPAELEEILALYEMVQENLRKL